MNPSSVNPRSLPEIQEDLQSHNWQVMSADKSPWGIISRFACVDCEDEFVAMLTSSRKSRMKKPATTNLEVSTKNVILN